MKADPFCSAGDLFVVKGVCVQGARRSARDQRLYVQTGIVCGAVPSVEEEAVGVCHVRHGMGEYARVRGACESSIPASVATRRRLKESDGDHHLEESPWQRGSSISIVAGLQRESSTPTTA